MGTQWQTKNIEDEAVAVPEGPPEEQEADVEQAPVDLDEAEEIVTSVSQIKPTQSQISKMSGKTYISQLQK